MLESLSCGHFQLENSSVAIIRNSFDQPIADSDNRPIERRHKMNAIERKSPAVRTPVCFLILAQRFAEAGIDAVAIDYFGRTAETGDRSEGFEYMPHIEKTTPEGISADVAAAIAHLRTKDGGAVRSVFTVGFCFGGSSSWNQSALNPGLDGCIGFYGRPQRSLPFISRMKAPLLMLIAGADGATPQEAFIDFDHKLTEAKAPHEMHVYDGAPHSFFDRGFAQWKDACDDAWRRMLAFISKPST